MTAPTVYWSHGASAEANEHGIAWLQTSGPIGSHVVLFGGYAEGDPDSTSTDVFGNDADGQIPIAASYPVYDPGDDTFRVGIGFAAPPGAIICAHIWAVLV